MNLMWLEVYRNLQQNFIIVLKNGSCKELICNINWRDEHLNSYFKQFCYAIYLKKYKTGRKRQEMCSLMCIAECLLLTTREVKKQSWLLSWLLVFCYRTEVRTARKRTKIGKQTGTKILVRNIPFQATVKEVMDLFKYVHL